MDGGAGRASLPGRSCAPWGIPATRPVRPERPGLHRAPCGALPAALTPGFQQRGACFSFSPSTIDWITAGPHVSM